VVNRVVVGAHYGLRGWLVQRVSAVLMALYTAVFLVAYAVSRPRDFVSWKGFMSQGWLRLATTLFFASLALHAWVGMRDILMDYVKPAGIRLALETAVIVALAAFAAWTASVLWR
jgi:succinate dehydrogenase / fumarate reductase membrane anchor subunit